MIHSQDTLTTFHAERLERLRRSYARPGLLGAFRRRRAARRAAAAGRYGLAA